MNFEIHIPRSILILIIHFPLIHIYNLFTQPMRIWCLRFPPLIFVSPIIILNLSNYSLASSLVKMSTIFSFVEQCHKWKVFASKWYQIKWFFVLICLVQSWNLGLFSNLIAKVLSIRKGVELTCFSYKSSRIFLSHAISLVSSTTATYFSFVMESTGTECLCYLQDTNIYPRLIL